VIRPIYHATVLFVVGGKTVLVDPVSKADLNGVKADLVLVTDVHQDHMDKEAITRAQAGEVVAPPAVVEQLGLGRPLANGEKMDWNGIGIEAVPMYNLVRGPEAGKLYHDKGRGNGYVLTMAGQRVYLSGDTECIPEMKALTDIDIAFVCMNLPYTMPPAEAAECIRAFRPKILYPYHYRSSNLDELGDLGAVEVRRRSWY